MIYVAAFFVAFAYVFLRAFQQQNVMTGKYAWVMPTSMAMAMGDVFIITRSAATGWGWIVPAIGLGGGLGCICSMYLHRRWNRG